MSNFERRVSDVNTQFIDERFQALEKLDPEIARRYVIGTNADNARRLREGPPKNPRPGQRWLTGRGGFNRDDVDAVMEAALDGGVITEKEEEALLIILGSARQFNWVDGAKEYMVLRIQESLRHLWSSRPIEKDEAARLLAHTQNIDFVSAGDKHQGTGLHYTPALYQIVPLMIDQVKMEAWEVSSRRSYLRTDAGKGGADGYYDQDTNEIYMIRGLAPRDQKSYFTHEVTHALQDFHNVPHVRSIAKFTEADAYIAQASAALALGMPYNTQPRRPEEVATRGAAAMLTTPLGKRDAAWKRNFRQAYDDVVDAYAARHVNDADDLIDMLEGKQEQKREQRILNKMLQALKGQKPKKKMTLIDI